MRVSGNAATTSAVPSVERSSITTSSQSENVWASTDRTVSPMKAAAL